MNQDETTLIAAAKASLDRFHSDIQVARQELQSMGEGEMIVDAALMAVRSLSSAERLARLSLGNQISTAEPATSGAKAAVSTLKALADLAAASRSTDRLSDLDRAAIQRAEPAARTLVHVATSMAKRFASDANTAAMFSRVEQEAIDAYRQLSGSESA